MNQIIEPPNDADVDQIAGQLVYARALVKDIIGEDLGGSANDLDLLQKVLDSGKIDAESTYELQSLGLVFGKVFVNENAGYDWWMVEDEYGRDPAIRLKQTSLLIFPLTMISKRIEDGEVVNVRDIYKCLIDRLGEVRAQNGECS